MKPKFAASKVLPLLILIMLLSPACQRQSQLVDEAPGVKLSLAIKPEPPTAGDSLITLILTDHAGVPIEGAEIEVRGDMTHAGMVPQFGGMQEVEPGSYVVPFEWTMAGDWILTITGKLPDGRVLRRTFDTTVQPGAADSMEDT